MASIASASSAKTWVEISKSALLHNVEAVRRLVAPAEVMAVVKANAYGHGLLEVAKSLRQANVRWFGVDHIDEALVLRKAGITRPILILGYTPLNHLADALKQDVSLTVYNSETIRALQRIATQKYPARLHLKVETGLTRQGVSLDELPAFLHLMKKYPHLHIEGVSTHFANIEEGENHAYAKKQLAHFAQAIALLKVQGFDPKWKHTACSAAAILYPETYFNLIRLGLAMYGFWPSDETRRLSRRRRISLTLRPVLSWKTRVVQIKSVARGTPIGYGLTQRVMHDSKVAVLPIGYYDGYDRVGMSNAGTVLIHGRRCKILGRICMNMCMADVTDVKRAQIEDEVVIIGQQGKETVTAEELASHMGSINYEVVTRINPLIPRVLAD